MKRRELLWTSGIAAGLAALAAPAVWAEALGPATPGRTPLAPELPTLAESGLPGFEFYSWYGVWAPRHLPPEIAERINTAIVEGLHEPEMVQRLAGQGFEPVRETIPQIEAAIAQDVRHSAELLRVAKFEPQ